MTTDDDPLGWLDDESADGPQTGAMNGAEEEFQDALDWLQEAEEDEGPAAPAGGGGDGGGDGGLGWLEGDDAAAPAVVHDPGEEDEPQSSIFSMALDDFFEDMEAAPAEAPKAPVKEGDATIVTGRKRRKRRTSDEQKIDRVMNTLVRYLTRKEAVRESQLDTIFRLTVGKIVDPISAEVVVVYFMDDDGSLHFAHLFYSRSLFRNHPGLEGKFNKSLESLGQLKIDAGAGIVGRALSGKKSITSLDASNDRDFLNHLGKATGYTVRTMLTVPIVDHEKAEDGEGEGTHHLYGAIQVMNKDPNSGEEFFSYQDLKLLEEISQFLGRIIHLVRDPDIERTDEEIATYYARMAKTEVIDPTSEELFWDDRLWDVVGVEAIERWKILPVKKLDSKTLEVVMANPLDMTRRSSFEAASELQIGTALVATPAQIDAVIAKVLKKGPKSETVDGSEFEQLTSGFEENQTESVELKDGEGEESGPIIKLVNRIVEDAYARGASDIHIEPYETYARVRYRCDGSLSERMRLPIKALSNIVARIKIMSELDIAERRLPQDGKIKFKRYSRRGLDIDLRVATGPMTFGEKVVMRILAKGSISLGLDAMGFSEPNLAKYRWACKQPYGMILNVGPTGSGKTTTLYSGLSEVNSVHVNIQTAEDPVEYPLDGINQMQMQKTIGLDFARALRCYMRMDPDIILVGEIRDVETAEIAIEASLTGHLLFSTLHTNDAAGTITRFTEMGIEPFMISSSLLVVTAQRLIRRTCDKCRQVWVPTDREIEILKLDPDSWEDKTLYQSKEHKKGKPCPKCSGSGYRGRCGVHEVMSLNDEIRALINKKASANILKDCAVESGMKTIFQDALQKVKEGVSDLPEVMAKVKMDETKGAKQSDLVTLD